MSDQYIKINYLSLLKRKKKTAKKINFLKQQQQNNRCLPIKLATVSLGFLQVPAPAASAPPQMQQQEGEGGSLSRHHRPTSQFLLWVLCGNCQLVSLS